MGKMLSKEALLVKADEWRLNKKKVVLTNGCFDILHAGHVRYLMAARALGDLLVVGLNSDVSVKTLKGEGRPVNNEFDRAEVLAALEAVDAVVIFSEKTAEDLVQRLKPSIYAKGGDYETKALPESESVVANGGKVVLLPMVEGKSTTNVINAMKGT